jgi:ribonuclease VapC
LLQFCFIELEANWFEAAIFADSVRLISAASLLECSIVLDRHRGERSLGELDGFVHRTKIEIVAVSIEQAEIARGAYRQFGRGRHRAALNFGDCFSYTLAKVSGESLLCKGNDFAQTDLAVISPPPSPQST